MRGGALFRQVVSTNRTRYADGRCSLRACHVSPWCEAWGIFRSCALNTHPALHAFEADLRSFRYVPDAFVRAARYLDFSELSHADVWSGGGMIPASVTYIAIREKRARRDQELIPRFLFSHVLQLAVGTSEPFGE